MQQILRKIIIAIFPRKWIHFYFFFLSILTQNIFHVILKQFKINVQYTFIFLIGHLKEGCSRTLCCYHLTNLSKRNEKCYFYQMRGTRSVLRYYFFYAKWLFPSAVPFDTRFIEVRSDLFCLKKKNCRSIFSFLLFDYGSRPSPVNSTVVRKYRLDLILVQVLYLW